jgi:hypothetical protein
MLYTIFDGDVEIEMTRQEIIALPNEQAAELYQTNEIYRTVLKRKVQEGDHSFAPLVKAATDSSEFLLNSLIARFGEDPALGFAAEVSLMIMLESNETIHHHD